MKFSVTILAALAIGCASGQAAQIDLQNAVDGSASLTMSPAATADVNLVIIIAAIDTIQVSFVNAFFDTNNDDAEVVALAGGQAGWTYDRTAFQLPAALDEAGDSEYGLVSGSQDGSAALPLGAATRIMDVLTLETEAELGSTNVTFELGARAPQVFGPPPDYWWFFECPFLHCFPFPNVLQVGDSNGYNSPFIINYVPEPMAVIPILMASASICIRRARGPGEEIAL